LTEVGPRKQNSQGRQKYAYICFPDKKKKKVLFPIGFVRGGIFFVLVYIACGFLSALLAFGTREINDPVMIDDSPVAAPPSRNLIIHTVEKHLC